jgi:hypothetical protein
LLKKGSEIGKEKTEEYESEEEYEWFF